MKTLWRRLRRHRRGTIPLAAVADMAAALEDYRLITPDHQQTPPQRRHLHRRIPRLQRLDHHPRRLTKGPHMPERQQPAEGTCGRCTQTRPLFPAKTDWGRVPTHLCSPCWSRYADARAAHTFVDFNDAFDNATDEQLSDGLGLTPR